MNDNTLPAFSLIIPVYNGASVIQRCIDSVLAQTYPTFELIMVDDGSKDTTAEICGKYAATDSRVHYHRQENGGVSAARNCGLSLAQNEFVLFVDADDFLSPGYLDTFYRLLLQEGIRHKTLVYQDFMADLFYKDGREESHKWCGFPYGRFTMADAFAQLPLFDWLQWGVPFAKLFRLSVIRQHHIAFNQHITFKEDLIFMLEYLQYMETIIFEPTANYHYIIDHRKQTLSNTVASFTSEHLFFTHMKRLADFFIAKFKPAISVTSILYNSIYIAFFRSINSCMYQYKLPMPRSKRLENIRLLSTAENLRHLSGAGVIDNKMKQLAFMLLKSRQYWLYDLLNAMRYKSA